VNLGVLAAFTAIRFGVCVKPPPAVSRRQAPINQEAAIAVIDFLL
jgi:hypothetical protein